MNSAVPHSSDQKDPQRFDLLQLIPTEARLRELADSHAATYSSAQPFAHVQFDDFLPAEVARKMVADFPGPGEVDWIRFRNRDEHKLAASRESLIPPSIRNVLYALNSQTFLTFLEKLTGIHGLIADPYFKGGGMHQTERGGKLGVHIDFNRYDHLSLYRRLNVLIYLNEDWREDYGGALELWSQDGKRCEKRINPLFNRCVIFNTIETSYHGHPHPLTCPEGRTRRSVALYYYTATDPAIPSHTTVFIANSPAAKMRKIIEKSAMLLLPPIVPRLYRRLFHKN